LTAKPRKTLEKALAGRVMKDYHVNIFYSQDDEGYIADIPDLEACSAFGATPAAALAQVELAKAAWLEAARAEGKPIPEPRYRPVIYQLALQPASRLAESQGVYHVIPSLRGGWEVKKSGASRASRRFEHKQDAVKYGRRVSQNRQTQLVIHGQ
jgi:predicted RNase H-like HicB family nuclease